MPRTSPPTPVGDPLSRCVAAILDSRPDLRLEDLHCAASTIMGNPDLLRDSLALLRTDPPALEDAAARSSLHANGFAKIVLHAGNGWGIRMHVWPCWNRSPDVEAKPHGHRWEFASWIITGEIRETMWHPAAIGEPFVLCDYGRKPDGTPYLRARGTASLAPGERFDRPAGVVYARSGSAVHVAEPLGGELVASLVVQGKRSHSPTLVYRRPSILPVHQEQALSTDDLTALLAEVAEVLP